MKRRAFKPTRKEKQLMSSLGMDLELWLVKHESADHVTFVHRHTGALRKYPHDEGRPVEIAR